MWNFRWYNCDDHVQTTGHVQNTPNDNTLRRIAKQKPHGPTLYFYGMEQIVPNRHVLGRQSTCVWPTGGHVHMKSARVQRYSRSSIGAEIHMTGILFYIIDCALGKISHDTWLAADRPEKIKISHDRSRVGKFTCDRPRTGLRTWSFETLLLYY